MSRGRDIYTVPLFDAGDEKPDLPPGGIYTKLVGVARVPGAQSRIERMKRLGVRYLISDREPSNRFDPNAIRFLLPPFPGKPEHAVGYLDRDLAAALAPVVDARAENGLRCRVELITGEDQQFFGVNVALFYDDAFDLLPYHPRFKKR